jgi:hypothetical protein
MKRINLDAAMMTLAQLIAAVIVALGFYGIYIMNVNQ